MQTPTAFPSPIEAQVTLHALRCERIALAARPPGYSVKDWTLHLMEKPPDVILRRAVLLSLNGDADSQVPHYQMPAWMAVMAQRLAREFTREFYRNAVQQEVDLLRPARPVRSAEVLRQAELRARNRVQEVSDLLCRPLEGQIMLKMGKDGRIKVTVI